jgi:hypothetical protein
LKPARRCQKLAGYNSDEPPPHFKEVTQGHYPTSKTFLSSLVTGFIGHWTCRWNPLVFFTVCVAMLRFWSVANAIEAKPTVARPVQMSLGESQFVRPADAISKRVRVG